MFYGAQISADNPVTPTIEDGGETLHISQVCLVDPKDSNKTYVQIVDGEKSFCIAALEKDKCENVSLDLFVSATDNLKFTTKGGNNEVHLVGYFEPDNSCDHYDDDDDSDNEGNFDYLKQMEENSFDEDEDDEDEDEELDADGVSKKDSIPRIEEIDDEEYEKLKKIQIKKNEDKKNLNEEKNDDNDEDSDDENEIEEKENKKIKGKQNGKELSKQQNKTNENNSQKRKIQNDKSNTNNQPKKQKQEGKSSKGTNADKEEVTVESFHSELIKYLKANGKTNMGALGQKIKKPSTIDKLGAYVKEHSSVFKVENGFVSLVV